MYRNQIPETTINQWKQRLQFELEGIDYAKALIFNSHEEVSILPFYSSENNVFIYGKNIHSEAIIPLYCSNVIQTLKRIEFWQTKGVKHFYITIHPEIEHINTFWQQLPMGNVYLFQCLDNEFNTSKSSSNFIYIAKDIICEAFKRGNLPNNGEFDNFVNKFRTESFAVLVDTSLYQNAGATIIQQIAYGSAQMVEYLKRIEKIAPKTVRIYFKIAVSDHFLFEVSKIRAFRQVVESISEVFSFKIECFFISEPSQRGLSILKTSYNQNYVLLGYESSVLGGSDFVMPKNETIYRKNTLDNEVNHIQKIQEIIQNRDTSFVASCYCFETISYEIAKKSLLFFKRIEKSGGLIEQFKSHSLQKKIREKSNHEQLYFDNLVRKLNLKTDLFAKKQDWELYPFMKQRQEKTTFEPLIMKRIWENLEKTKRN